MREMEAWSPLCEEDKWTHKDSRAGRQKEWEHGQETPALVGLYECIYFSYYLKDFCYCDETMFEFTHKWYLNVQELFN